MTENHNSVVRRQFGARASDYVTSTVHAEGADLAHIAAIAAACAPAHALDLGCGGGHVSYAVAAHAARMTACDLSGEMLTAVELEAARRGIGNIDTRYAAAEALPFSDGSLDFLACRFSAHHWQNIGAGLSETRRVLQPGAPAVFVDVIAPPLAAADTHLQAVELLRDGSHVRDYSRSQWHAMLEKAGFVVGAMHGGRLRMNFKDWTARMRTPDHLAAAIRMLQKTASSEVARHFAIEDDGSFTLDTLLVEVR